MENSGRSQRSSSFSPMNSRPTARFVSPRESAEVPRGIEAGLEIGTRTVDKPVARLRRQTFPEGPVSPSRSWLPPQDRLSGASSPAFQTTFSFSMGPFA